MSALEFRRLEGEAGLREAYAIIHELRTELSVEDFRSLVTVAARRDEYELLGAFHGGTCVGVLGHRVLFDLVHGKHLYIDDLVVTARLRSRGVGAKLLREAEAIARAKGCASLRLCTGIANDGGRRFYEREGWALRSVAYKKKL